MKTKIIIAVASWLLKRIVKKKDDQKYIQDWMQEQAKKHDRRD